MKTRSLDYHLPKELIAQGPAQTRSESKLLILHRSNGDLIDSTFSKLAGFLKSGDCLVLNDTKVVPARFFAHRRTGARLEGLFLSEREAGIWQVMLKGIRKVKNGEIIVIENKSGAEASKAEVVEKKEQGICMLKLSTRADAKEVLTEIGFAPLPPYIKRTGNISLAVQDGKRYQTVYARRAGAVAAPTAGLHFTRELLEKLQEEGIHIACLTLHIGIGTFKPVTEEYIERHKMHQENFCIDAASAQMINAAKERGRRIIAVGTSSVRVLESIADNSHVKAIKGSTGLFITPGYKFSMIDGMVTNFHLPMSTPLALVAAMAGIDRIFAAYEHAIKGRYRFYSYGDAMLIV
ncbi:MAG: tRNA preQ1(34) S-adenosylmethionine ribosyltransferase-isomerase QueA [Sedimentisphaerales bacterium]|nr:tRNA preQ1(34) S-adenosylmethionine ribosyltransferase-isomerase QueA [Sedimentisphaerales bacterium]